MDITTLCIAQVLLPLPLTHNQIPNIHYTHTHLPLLSTKSRAGNESCVLPGLAVLYVKMGLALCHIELHG